MNPVALILVANAIILASMDETDLPDDFSTTSETTAAVEGSSPHQTTNADPPAAVTVEFSQAVAVSSGLKTVAVPAFERWLVSEPWCSKCPAAKSRFIASGGKKNHIISIQQARDEHGISVSGVPHEFQTQTTRDVVNPVWYRTATEMKVTLNDSSRPAKSAILGHLRTGGPHQGKHWQQWNLESWAVGQLYALHDDDHAGKVPTFEPESTSQAVVSQGDLSPALLSAVLLEHLAREDTPDSAVASLFTVDIDIPDGARVWTADLLTRRQMDLATVCLSPGTGIGRFRSAKTASASLRGQRSPLANT